MKKLVTILCLLGLSLTSFAQDLGLPDNSASKPPRAAKTNTSYSAVASYPSHSEDIYFDLGQMTTYVKKGNGESRIEKMDSLVTYQLNDNKKTYEVVSLQGITTQRSLT